MSVYVADSISRTYIIILQDRGRDGIPKKRMCACYFRVNVVTLHAKPQARFVDRN